MDPVPVSTSTRRPSAASIPTAGAAAADAPVHKKDTVSALRPPAVYKASTRPRSHPLQPAQLSRATFTATTTAVPTTFASLANRAALPLAATPASDAEQKVRALVLAFLRKPDAGNLDAPERALVADLSAVVQQLVAERDDARRELHDHLRKQHVDVGRLSPTTLARFADVTIHGDDDVAMNGNEVLEDKPTPTMWQLIAANYIDDPDLAAAWTGLRDDPAFADLHAPAAAPLFTQARARLRGTQF